MTLEQKSLTKSFCILREDLKKHHTKKLKP